MSRLGAAHSIALVGLTGHPVTVEAQISAGLPAFHLIGLPDTALKESRHRVRAAMTSAGITWADQRCTVNLSPAALPKTGAGFDLAIAAAILAATVKKPHDLGTCIYIGELSLDGSAKPVPGVLPMIKAARDSGFTRAFIAQDSLAEASLVPGIELLPISGVPELAHWITTGQAPPPPSACASSPATAASVDQHGGHSAPIQPPRPPLDLAEVAGQEAARYALELAAAGGHHLFYLGVPGAGKTMLASRLPSILEPLQDDEALEATSIQSVLGRGVDQLITTPPFVAPHHSSSIAALVGGGTGMARPGAISQAHNGVLFLDEAPEFPPSVLNALRQPLESGVMTLHRATAVVQYPARFQLVLAANPCPCGWALGAPGKCSCSANEKRRYLNRIPGPLWNRIDLTCPVYNPGPSALTTTTRSEDSATVAARVRQARSIARSRWAALEADQPTAPGSDAQPQVGRGVGLTNATVNVATLQAARRRCSAEVNDQIYRFVADGTLSMRGADRLYRVCWTVADLAGHTSPTVADLAVAIAYRMEFSDVCNVKI